MNCDWNLFNIRLLLWYLLIGRSFLSQLMLNLHLLPLWCVFALFFYNLCIWLITSFAKFAKFRNAADAEALKTGFRIANIQTVQFLSHSHKFWYHRRHDEVLVYVLTNAVLLLLMRWHNLLFYALLICNFLVFDL